MKIISRAAAKAAGLSKYFTGKPCKQGHIAERMVDGGCIECRRVRDRRPELYERKNRRRRSNYDPELAKRQREANLETRRRTARESARRCRAADPSIKERDRESARRWRLDHRDQYDQYRIDNREHILAKARETSKRRRLEKPAEVSEALKRWRISNPDKTKAYSHRRRDWKAANTFTAADWRTLVSRSPRCHWCKRAFNNKRRPTHDHVVPLAKGGANTIENSVCACRECNASKHAKLINPVTGQGILL